MSYSKKDHGNSDAVSIYRVLKYCFEYSFILIAFYALPLSAAGQSLHLDTGTQAVISGPLFLVLNNLSFANNGNFQACNGTVEFRGNTDTSMLIVANGSHAEFQNVIVNMDKGAVIFKCPATIANSLDIHTGKMIAEGNLNLGAVSVDSGASFYAGNYTDTIFGLVQNRGEIISAGQLVFFPSMATTLDLGTDFTSSGTVDFAGTGMVDLKCNTPEFYNLIISNTAVPGITPSGGWSVKNNFTLKNGSVLNASIHTYEVGGDVFNYGNFYSGASTFLLNGTSNQEIYSPSNFYNLAVIKNAGEITLATHLNIDGEMTFTKGVINTTAAKMLVFGTAAKISGMPGIESYINGPAAKKMADGSTGEFLFPLGKSAGNPVYNPCSVIPVVITGGNTTFTAEYMSAPLESTSIMGTPGLAGMLGNSYWKISNSSAVSTAKIGLQYAVPPPGSWIYYNGSGNQPYYDIASDPFPSCNVQIIGRDSTTGAWNINSSQGSPGNSSQGYLVNTMDGFIYSGSINNLNTFSIGYTYDNILPVDITDFSGKVVNNNACLTWKCNENRSVASFMLQHSSDGKLFSDLAGISPLDTGEYFYDHISPGFGKHWYRLVIKEKNGTSVYSRIVLLPIGLEGTRFLGLASNPVASTLIPLIFSCQDQDVKASITGIQGNSQTHYYGKLVKGYNKWQIPVHGLKKGFYIISILTSDGQKTSIKFLKE